MSRIRKLSAVVTAVALVGAGGLSAAQAATSTDAGPRGDRPAHRQGGPMPSAALEKIAGQLGVTTAQLRAAMQATRPAKPAADSGPRDGKASELAAALDIDVAKVKAALDKIEAAHKAEHTARETAMHSALAKKLGVSADAVKAAFEANRPARPAKSAA